MALFGKQESLESSQESRNLEESCQDSESRRRKYIVSGPSAFGSDYQRNLLV